MEQITEIIEKAAEKFSYKNILDELSALKEFEKNAQNVDVVILGRFKAGKSSFLNALLNKNILPAGVLPVTAIITGISFAEKENVVVTHLDGKKVEIPFEHLPLYVTEKNNPENEKKVFTVDIFTGAMKKFKNIRFIDTPGLGSAFKHNSKVTEKWYNKIGAALVVINSTQACSESDADLLNAAMEHSPVVNIVLSKADLLSDADNTEVLNFVKSRVAEKFNKEIKIFPFSIINNTADYSNKIINEVLLPLNENFSSVRQSIYMHKLGHIKDLTLSYLKISFRLRQKQEDERKELKNKIIDERLKIDYLKNELALISKNYTEKTRGILQKELVEKNMKKSVRKITTDFDRNFDKWNGNLNKVAREYEKWLKSSVLKCVSEIETENRDFVNGYSEKAGRHFTNYCKDFRARINGNIKKVLDVSLPDDEFSISVEPVEKPDISTSWAFESHIDLLWFLIPMPVFRGYFKKHFRKQLHSEIEKNLYRLASQLTKNINAGIEKLHRESFDYITSQLAAIEKLLSEKSNDGNEVSEYIDKLSNSVVG